MDDIYLDSGQYNYRYESIERANRIPMIKTVCASIVTEDMKFIVKYLNEIPDVTNNELHNFIFKAAETGNINIINFFIKKLSKRFFKNKDMNIFHYKELYISYRKIFEECLYTFIEYPYSGSNYKLAKEIIESDIFFKCSYTNQYDIHYNKCLCSTQDIINKCLSTSIADQYPRSNKTRTIEKTLSKDLKRFDLIKLLCEKSSEAYFTMLCQGYKFRNIVKIIIRELFTNYISEDIEMLIFSYY